MKPPLNFDFDAEGIAKEFKEFAADVEKELMEAAKILASMTKNKVDQLANDELKSSREEFKKSVGWEEITPGIYVVFINEEALWQEDGRGEGSMIDNLLKNATKVSKDGHRYRSIPFDHGTTPQNTSQRQVTQDAVKEVRDFLKSRNISISKLDRQDDGKTPRLGRIHSFDKTDISGKPPTTRSTHGALEGLSVYQTKDKKTGNVRRDIMTFRTVSDGPGSAGKWISPGYEGKNFLDRAADWAKEEWEQKILPEILSKWSKN